MKKLEKIQLFMLTMIALLLTACGSAVTTVKADDVNLSSYNSFAYLPNTDIKIPNSTLDTDLVNNLVVETINTNMEGLGYSLDKENPDLLILISTKTNSETSTTKDPIYAAYPYANAAAVNTYYSPYSYSGYRAYNNIIGYDTETYTYKEGTVIIDLVDRKTKKLIWKGRSSQTIYDQTTTSAIREVVNTIFQEFPVK